MALMGLFTLLVLGFLSITVGFIRARFDGQRGRYRPVVYPLLVATSVTAVVMTMLVSVLYQAMQAGVGQPVFRINIIGLIVAAMVMFIVTFTTSGFGYLIGYRGAEERLDSDFGGEAPAIQMDETGNPYQPPST
jgi:hypothetical protein